MSLDVADPHAIARVDELSFDDDDNQWGWNRRSVTVTTERMYVAGPEYGNNGPVGSSIQVVDISDAIGLPGASDPHDLAGVVDLGRALRGLSPDDRRLLALRFVAGLSSDEIAGHLGLSASGVRSRLARLIDRLRAELDESGAAR